MKYSALPVEIGMLIRLCTIAFIFQLLYSTDVWSAYVFCKDGWTMYSNNCYKLFWLEPRAGVGTAERRCRRHGAQLLVFDDQDEYDFIGSIAPTELYMYLGITDNEEEGIWKTFSGKPVTFFKWDTSRLQPDNAAGYGDKDQNNCVMQFPSGLWDDAACYPTDSFWIRYYCKLENDDILKTSQEMDASSYRNVRNRYLMDFSFLNITVKSKIECGKECLRHRPECISANYKHAGVTEGEPNCVLNHGSHRDANFRFLPNKWIPTPADLNLGQWVYLRMEDN